MTEGEIMNIEITVKCECGEELKIYFIEYKSNEVCLEVEKCEHCAIKDKE